ncbi:unnamed protein product [Victoria cruziana]
MAEESQELSQLLRHQKIKLGKRPREEADIDESEEDSPRKQTKGAPESPPLESQKCKKWFIWTTELNKKFAFAVDQMGFENATPSKILDIMGVSELARKQIGSRLQKHRIFRRKYDAESRERKGLSVSGGLGSPTTMGLANQISEPLPPTAVVEAQCGSLGVFTNMPSYYSSYRADDREVLGTYGLMNSTYPTSSIGRIPYFMQEQRNMGDKSIFQNTSISSFMQEQRNQGDESIFQNPFMAHVKQGFDPISTMWHSSSYLKPGDHEFLQLQAYAFAQQAENDGSASTPDFGTTLGSDVELIL